MAADIVDSPVRAFMTTQPIGREPPSRAAPQSARLGSCPRAFRARLDRSRRIAGDLTAPGLTYVNSACFPKVNLVEEHIEKGPP